MNDPKCDNCGGNVKSQHSKQDTRCLLVMNWKPEEFEPVAVPELAAS